MFDTWSNFESKVWKLVFTPTLAMNKDQLLIKAKKQQQQQLIFMMFKNNFKII